MTLDKKIKKYIKLLQNATNTVDKQAYLQKLNECKNQLIDILCEHNDFFGIYYNNDTTKTIGNLDTQEFVRNFFETYSIKNIYCSLDKNFCTKIINIDFNI